MVTCSPVTSATTSGPVRNMELVPRAITTKSVSAGEYTAPPAQGPRIREIWGITPEASTLRTKTSPYAARLATPSWIRAPPESLSPMSGTPLSMARSLIRLILLACTRDIDPPRTVKSWANTATRRPLILPNPATTPSPGNRWRSSPKAVSSWVASAPISWNEPSSRSRASRSRAVSLPRACWAAMRSGPPPSTARARMARRVSRCSVTSVEPAPDGPVRQRPIGTRASPRMAGVDPGIPAAREGPNRPRLARTPVNVP